MHAVTAGCRSLHEAELGELLRALLYTFPMREVRVFLPAWVRALELEHPLKAALYAALRENAAGFACLPGARPAARRPEAPAPRETASRRKTAESSQIRHRTREHPERRSRRLRKPLRRSAPQRSVRLV